MEPLPLKDIHLPDAIGWWPPAPGWWLVAVVLVLLIIVIHSVYKRLTRQTAINSARKLLSNIRSQQSDTLQTLTDLSTLLRRTAISTDSRSEVAGLRGQAWLDYLDRSLPDQPFGQGIGRCLADAHYRPTVPANIDIEALFSLCERWLKQQRNKT